MLIYRLQYLFIIFMCGFALTTASAQDNNTENNAPINFSADHISNDEENGIITAKGNVTITQRNLRLEADQVIYNRNSGEAFATGSVIFNDEMGNQHYTEHLRLNNQLTHAIFKPVISKLSDGSWIGAQEANYSAHNISVFNQAEFTPCDCDFIGGETPAWSLHTSNSEHNPNTKTFTHRNVNMRIYGIPFLYIPVLKHPDWTVKRASGLLPPRFSFSSDTGTSYAQPYYWVTGESHDVEITPHIFGDNGTAIKTFYRQRWDHSSLNASIISGSLNTFKKNRENVAGIDARFTTTLADQWKTSARLYRSSQDTFMRRYNFDQTKILRSTFTAERITPSRYSLIDGYDIQDLVNGDSEPTVLPSVFHERYLPMPFEDTTLRLRLNALKLDNDEETDLKRLTSELYALNDQKTNYGNLKYEGRLSLQFRDIENNTVGQSYTGQLGQAAIAAGVTWALPIAMKAGEDFAIVEPTAQFVTIRADDHTDRIPNRDSADFRLDEANLFLIHREQGEDYNITTTRLNGGLAMSAHNQYLGNISGFIGSSIRIDGERPQGANSASQDSRFSDIIANLSIQPNKNYALSMAGRFSPREGHLNEASFDAKINFNKTKIRLNYTELSQSFFDIADEEVQELIIKANQRIGHQWNASLSQTYDLTGIDYELTDSAIAVNYRGGIQDCLTISFGYSSDNTNDRDIKPSDELFLLFDFKYLGAVSSKGVQNGTN